MAGYTIIATGVPELAHQLRHSGRFSEVLEASTTGGLRDLIAQGQLAARADKAATVFIFADNTKCDTPEATLPRLIQRLTSTGWKVLLVAVTPSAAGMVQSNPAARLLEGPFSLNSVLAGLVSLGIQVEPVEEGFEQFDPTAPASAPRAAAPASAPSGDAGGWLPVGAAPAAPVAAAPQPEGAWMQPSAAPQGWAAPASTEPAAPQGWAAPASTEPGAPQGWAAPASTEPGAPQGWAAPASTEPGAPQGWAAPASTEPGAPQGWAAPASTEPGAPQGWLAPAGGLPPLGGGLPGVPQGSGQPAARAGTYGAQHQLATSRRGYVIVVTAPKGGTGKSSLSLNLTAYLGLRLRAQGKTVCIVDTNFQQADTGKYLNVYQPNITDIYKDQSTLTRERILTKMVHKTELGFSALLGPARSREANPQWINARLYNQILPLLKEHFDYIVVDTPVAELFHDIHRDFALPNADFILVPITPNLPTLMNADRWLYEICQPTHVAGGSGVDRNKIGVVLNRHKDTVGLSFEEIQTELSQWRIVGMVPDTDEWQRANNENALVATRNYRELNDAFSQILYAASGEPALVEGVTAVVTEPDGILARLRARWSR